MDLLTFEKNDIHWAQKGKVNIIFFKSQLIHTFTESKDSNCFILYVEEIVVIWNKKLHVHWPDIVLHYCLHHHAIYYLILYHLIYFSMFRPTKWQIFVLGTGGTSASIDPILFLCWRMRQMNYFFHWLIKIECS